MMGIQLLLIPIVYFVNFGLTSAQTLSLMENQAVTSKMNDEGETRKNFQSLLDSIVKNSTKKMEIYHEILKENVARERQTFDAMKEELWTAQSRNAHKKQSFYQKSDINENIVLKKRGGHWNHNTTGYELASTVTTTSPLDPAEGLRTLQIEMNHVLFIKNKTKRLLMSSKEMFHELSDTLRELMTAIQDLSTSNSPQNHHEELIYKGETCVEKVWQFYEELSRIVR